LKGEKDNSSKDESKNRVLKEFATESFVGILFGDFSSSTFLISISLVAGGAYCIFKFEGDVNLYFGIGALISGVLLLSWRIRTIKKQSKKKK
jgi:hypothetical protein